MSVKLDIYDFFSYLIPGGITTAAFFFILNKHFSLAIDFANLSLVEFLVFGILSYLIGYASDFIAGKTWIRLFRKKKLFETTMIDFNKRHPSLDVEFQEMGWYIPYSFVKLHNLEIAQDIDKFNVTNKMLKTSSFGILLFAIIFTVEFFLNNYLPIYLILGFSCLIVAVILAHEATRFLRWFYQATFQALVAVVAKPEQMPIKFNSKENLSKPDEK